MDYRQEIAQCIAKIIPQEVTLTAAEIAPYLEVPPQDEMGDFALPCFNFAKIMRQAPVKIAALLQEKLSQEEISWLDHSQVEGGYLNFFLKRNQLVVDIVQQIRQEGILYGQSNEGSGQTVIVEYSSPNIAKPFHVGHAFTTVIGQALANIYARLGYQVVRMNHLGDYGTQFGKLISAYHRYGKQEALETDAIAELLRIYVLFHKEAELQPELEDEARAYFKKLEEGNPDEVALWEVFRTLSLKEFSRIYQRLNIQFDNYNGESFYSGKIPEVIEMLKAKHLLVESEGAQVVMLDEYKLPPCIILKSDGTTIYASRDIAAVLYRDETYHFDKNIYVVGNPQAIHFKQVFAVLDKAGFAKAKDCIHVGFGQVRFPDRQFSTRAGNVVLLEELLDESVQKIKQVITSNESLADMSLVDEVAEKIGVGAIVYTFLHNGRERDIVFKWEEILDFEGDSAPYVLYSYARGKSILRKANEKGIELSAVETVDFSVLTTVEEFKLAKLMLDFPNQMRRTLQENEPSILVRQISLIARAFNRYYHNIKVLQVEDENLQKARLYFVQCVCDCLKSGLDLIGIATVEQM